MRRFRHRLIYTGEAGDSPADRPEVVESREFFVDNDGRVSTASGPGSLVDTVELPGEAIVPGFIDTHAHLSSLGGGPDDLDLRDLSKAVLLERVRGVAAVSSRDSWIAGTGWSDQPSWGGTPPTAMELDAASGGRPTVLFRRDRHALLASSSALDAAGIDASTPDPPGGSIRRHPATGAPTGLLVDAAMDAVLDVVPAPSAEQIIRDALNKARQLSTLGVTCVHEAFVEPPLWEGLVALVERGRSPLRVRAMLAGSWAEPPIDADGDWLRAIAIKGFADGALGSRGAHLIAPYADDSTVGLAFQSDTELAGLADRAEQLHLQLAIHAIGDRGARRALDLFEARATGSVAEFYRQKRWRMEHAQTIHTADMTRLRDLCVAVQPIHFREDAPWAKARLGVRRLPTSHRWRSLIDHGAVVGFGSDFPIESGDPLAAVRALVAGDHPLVPEWDRSSERLDRYAAFDGYWGRAAYLAFDELRLGRLKPGYLADFVCLSRDPFGLDGLDDLRVVATYVGGERVYAE